jgi:Rps23 Pro-64 3,4-dihydroxylase Tpa1-like proline 4-hydroxylase
LYTTYHVQNLENVRADIKNQETKKKNYSRKIQGTKVKEDRIKMNLIFNFENKLFLINNVLPSNLYKLMYTDFIKSRNKISFEKSIVEWRTYKEELDNMSTSFAQEDTSILLNYLNKYHIILKHNPFVNFLNSEFESHLRLTKYNQHLAWHDDKDDNFNDRTYAVTYYFNKTWGESWGGELMFKDELGSGFIPVIGNSMCIIKAGLRHKVNSVLKKTHPRFSIQTWVNDK